MGDPIRLLFVDDETDFVDYMTKRLSQHRFEVASYTNPVQALDETRDRTFDVALLDLKMPRLDGETLLGKLKARDPHLEIIILTAHGSPASAFRTGRDGACDYLDKPCDFDALVESISKAYARRLRLLHHEESVRIDRFMSHVTGLSAREILDELAGLHDELVSTTPIKGEDS